MPKAMAKKEETLPSNVRPDFIGGDNRGSEHVGADDLAIPRIYLVQALSKSRKKNAPEYIEGCDEGDMHNSVTRELYGTKLTVIPVMMTVTYNVLKDQDEGGGFAGAYSTEAEAEANRLRQDTPELWESVRTHNQFVLIVKDDGTTETAVVPMAKSKLKVSKKWNTIIQMAGGDRFGCMYEMTSVDDTNDNNQDFKNFAFRSLGWIPADKEALYREAEQFYTILAAGEARVDYSDQVNEGAPSDAEREF